MSVQTLTSWECTLVSVLTQLRPLSRVSVVRSDPSSSTCSSTPLNSLTFSMVTVTKRKTKELTLKKYNFDNNTTIIVNTLILKSGEERKPLLLRY